jgi:hypothetical protein
MSGQFSQIPTHELELIGQKLEALSKSFSSGGAPGLSQAGRTGTAAIAIDNLEPTVRSITMEDEDFLLTKSISTLPAKSTTYSYVLKTAVRSGADLWGVETMLPQEDASQYMRVAEVLRVQGIRKTITHLAQTVNDLGGYMLDLEAENDQNAALAMAESLERALYVGGDGYMAADGSIDSMLAANPNAPIRQLRGIQAQIREGNKSARGIIGDFVGYGNNRSTVFDAKGAVISRQLVDKVVSAVRENRGRITEAHCTVDQIRHFRATFFPFERGDLGASYQIRGAKAEAEPKQGFPLQTVSGEIQVIPSVFKYTRAYPEPIMGQGQQPVAGTITAGAQLAGSTTFKAGDIVRYVVQAVNINGMSMPSNELVVTIAADGNVPVISIPFAVGVEEFHVFRTAVGGQTGSWKACGKVLASRNAAVTTQFVDAQAILPGLDTVVFMPKQQYRCQLAVLGNMVSKMQLGLRGLASETCYVAYCAAILAHPRHHGLIQNAFHELDDTTYGIV